MNAQQEIDLVLVHLRGGHGETQVEGCAWCGNEKRWRDGLDLAQKMAEEMGKSCDIFKNYSLKLEAELGQARKILGDLMPDVEGWFELVGAGYVPSPLLAARTYLRLSAPKHDPETCHREPCPLCAKESP